MLRLFDHLLLRFVEVLTWLALGVRTIPHLVVHLFRVKRGLDFAWNCQLPSVCQLSLEDVITPLEHVLFQPESDLLTQLFRGQSDVVLLAVVDHRIVADQIDVREKGLLASIETVFDA